MKLRNGEANRLEAFKLVADPEGRVIDYKPSEIGDFFGLSKGVLDGVVSSGIIGVFDRIDGIEMRVPQGEACAIAREFNEMYEEFRGDGIDTLIGHADFSADGSDYHFHYGFHRLASGNISFEINDESELTHLKREIKRRLGMLERAIETYRTLFSKVAHDLKTPLSIIGSSINHIASIVEEDGGSVAKFVNYIRCAVAALELDIDKYLSLGLVDRSNIRARMKNLNLYSDVINPVQKLFGLILERDNAQLFYSITQDGSEHVYALADGEPDRDVMVRADPDHLRTIITNLLSNALKFGKKGTAIAIGYREAAHEVYVSNTQSSFDPEQSAIIFDRFGRLPQHERTKGSGVGMHVCDALAKAMGYQMEARSDNKTYAEFAVVMAR